MADELQVVSSQLPTNIEDVSKYVFVGREKLVALQAELRAMNKLDLVEEVRLQKLTEAQDLADSLLLAEMRLGELISELPEAQGKRTDLELEDSDVQKSKKEILDDMGLSVKTAQRYEKLAAHPEIVASVSAESREKGTIVSRTSVLRAISSSERIPKEQDIVTESNASSDEEDERLIPENYISSIREVLPSSRITDPAASRSWLISNGAYAKSFTKTNNGLSARWGSDPVWLFPPYYLVKEYVDRLLSLKSVTHAIVLVNNETETTWFRKLWINANAVLFHTGKIKFKFKTGMGYTGPDRGQVFFYIGDEPDKFLEEFSQYGVGVKLKEGAVKEPTENVDYDKVKEMVESSMA